jgi:5-methylcytosine-specific restriction endonuclease McrA
MPLNSTTRHVFSHPTDCPPSCLSRCARCKATKPCADFYRQKHNQSGLHSWCRICCRADHAAFIAARPDVSAKQEAGRWARRWGADKERLAARHKKWIKDHPEYARAAVKRRRAIKLSAQIVDLTDAQWEIIKQTYRHNCAYCGKSLIEFSYDAHVRAAMVTMDHVIPVKRGGNHTWSNIVPVCLSCNARKRDKDAPSYQPMLLI